ncbi:queuosine precursor transporter [Synechococcus sp. Nb3U1]|uniref:queuosine precursor transporter n=1 Tax=Synechococcus sp. Nb3U1 TaxID=1914529 RepID=UPI001F408289|nr:queuosine precursor transporter [Synechococcus sp. Nb3U1]MCF2969643.1 queuosine precursor transporter [Synechococcus sp. Nb3U1]
MTERAYRHLDAVTALFVAVLLISNVASSKILILGPFTFDGGTILFPLSYIFGDILTEVYGYARSRRVIWLGFIAAALMSVTFMIVGALPPAPDWPHQAAYDQILGLTPRIVLASLIAYWAGSFANAYVLARMKVWTQGRWLWTRTIGSTLVGQAVDTGLFVAIAFWGVFPGLGSLILSNYLFKCGVEALCTPLTYAITDWLKQQEDVDYFDEATDFNPFRLESASK